jgi:hypothetical protein
MIEGGHAAVQADEDVVGTSRVRELEKEFVISNVCLVARRWRTRSSRRPS